MQLQELNHQQLKHTSRESLWSYGFCSALTEAASMWQQLLGGQGSCQSHSHSHWTSEHHYMYSQIKCTQINTTRLHRSLLHLHPLTNTQPVTQAYVCLSDWVGHTLSVAATSCDGASGDSGLSSLGVPEAQTRTPLSECSNVYIQAATPFQIEGMGNTVKLYILIFNNTLQIIF